MSARELGQRGPLPTIALVAALLALACSVGPGPRAGAPAPAVAPGGAALGTVASGTDGAPLASRSAYTTISVSTAPWWVAAEAGYFREQGLDAELLRVDAGAALLAALQNNELDATGRGGPSIVYGYR